MSLYRLISRRTTLPSLTTFLTQTQTQTQTLNPNPLTHLQTRFFAFSSAEEAAAERRRRKRRLRIEPPLHALRSHNSSPPPPRDPNAKRLPDTTSSLTGPRLNLHNRIQSLIRAGDLDNASLLARQSVFSKTRPTVFTCNAVVASLYRASRFDEAVSIFEFFFNQNNIVPNIVSYNFLICTHCDCGNVDLGVEVYKVIVDDAPFGPSAVTFRHLTKGLVEAGRIGEAVDLLREMLNKGLGGDSLVYNNLIKGFLDLRDFDKANELFDELKERCLVYDGVVNATFMEWFFEDGKGKESMESYRELLDRKFRMTPATCNVLLEVLLKYGKKKEAWELFDTMLDNHTTPTFQAVNSESFNIMVNECFKEEKFDEAFSCFRKVGTKMGSRPFVMDVAGYTNMIVRFTEHGMIEEAEKFYNELQTKSLSQDVTAYRTLIDAYLKEKRIDDALGMFNKMVDVNLRVIPLYANKWFTELIESNKAVECSRILTKMGDREVKPDLLTYEIVVKGLVGVGELEVVVDIVGQVMRYAVGVTPVLKEYLLEVFEKEGRKEEMEKLLDEKRQGLWQPSRTQSSVQPKPGGVGQVSRPTSPSGYRPPGPNGAGGPSGYTSPTGTVGQSGYPDPAGQAGYQAGQGGGQPRFQPSGPNGTTYSDLGGSSAYTSPSGMVGQSAYSAPAGQVAYQAGQGGYQASPGHSGYQAGQGGYQTPTGQSGQGGYRTPSGQSGYQASSGQSGYQAGQGGYQTPSGQSGYQASSGQSGYQASVGQSGYQAGQGGYQTPSRQSGPGGYQTPSGPSGYQASSGPSGYQAPSGPSGYQTPSGPSGYQAPLGQSGYQNPSGQAGYQNPSGQSGYQNPSGQSGYQAGQGGYQTPSGQWQGGYQTPSGQSGHEVSSRQSEYQAGQGAYRTPS